MKTQIYLVMCVLFLAHGMHAQNGYRVGVGAMLPSGESEEVSTFGLNVDVGYLFRLGEDVELGPVTGYQHFFGETINGSDFELELDAVQFVPAAAAFVWNPVARLIVGADVGYAFGLNDGNDGGFYYAPRIAYGVSDAVYFVGSYRSVALDGINWNSIQAGIEIYVQFRNLRR